jgi:3-methylcrotonyl-CoA carboxylase alpha subunit
MRLVEREADLAAALESAVRESQAAFGDGRVLIEKFIANPRHIEVQVFGDSHGNVVHLFERDCSLQRRNQKVIEEAPAPGMPEELRARMCAAAVACAKAVEYEGAGTVEFLVEVGTLTADSPWYFIEMNTRLQVEHPVTETITGLDLVEWQLLVAAGDPLPLRQDEIVMSGHAIEARLNAEDPARGFLPSTDKLSRFELCGSEGVRVEAGYEQDGAVSPYYDSLLAKLIASGPDRAGAVARLAFALEHTVVAGPRTNLAFLYTLLRHPVFVEGRMDTGLIGRELETLTAEAPSPQAIIYGVTQMLWLARHEIEDSRRAHAWFEGAPPWNAHDGFQLGGPRRQQFTVLADGVPTRVEVEWGAAGPSVHRPDFADPPYPPVAALQTAGDANPLYVLYDMRQLELAWPTYEAGAIHEDDGASIRAPIVGRVARVFVKTGDTVAKGDRIAVVEAMKMEHVLHAPRDGVVAKVAAAEGQQVEQGAPIATLGE